MAAIVDRQNHAREKYIAHDYIAVLRKTPLRTGQRSRLASKHSGSRSRNAMGELACGLRCLARMAREGGKRVLVLGPNAFTLRHLREVPGAERYEFVPVAPLHPGGVLDGALLAVPFE